MNRCTCTPGYYCPQPVTIFDVIATAKEYLATDPHLANYMLRDCQEVRDAGLDDLAWAMHRGSPHKNDVVCLIEKLEKHLKKEQP